MILPLIMCGNARSPTFGIRADPLNAYRGDASMKEPCRSCDRKEIDFGGCRCQAFALTGDAAATAPACSLCPPHLMSELTGAYTAAEAPPFKYRRIGRE